MLPDFAILSLEEGANTNHLSKEAHRSKCDVGFMQPKGSIIISNLLVEANESMISSDVITLKKVPSFAGSPILEDSKATQIMDVGDANMELKDFVKVEATSKGVGNMVLTYSTLKVVLADDVDTILKDYGTIEIMHIDVPFTII